MVDGTPIKARNEDAKTRLLIGGLSVPRARALAREFETASQEMDREIESLKRKAGSQEAMRQYMPALTRKSQKELFRLKVRFR